VTADRDLAYELDNLAEVVSAQAREIATLRAMIQSQNRGLKLEIRRGLRTVLDAIERELGMEA